MNQSPVGIEELSPALLGVRLFEPTKQAAPCRCRGRLGAPHSCIHGRHRSYCPSQDHETNVTPKCAWDDGNPSKPTASEGNSEPVHCCLPKFYSLTCYFHSRG